MTSYTVVRSLVHANGKKTITHRSPAVDHGILIRFMNRMIESLQTDGYCVKIDMDDWSFIAIRGTDEPALEYRLD
jgi:hypothetical protein